MLLPLTKQVVKLLNLVEVFQRLLNMMQFPLKLDLRNVQKERYLKEKKWFIQSLSMILMLLIQELKGSWLCFQEILGK